MSEAAPLIPWIINPLGAATVAGAEAVAGSPEKKEPVGIDPAAEQARMLAQAEEAKQVEINERRNTYVREKTKRPGRSVTLLGGGQSLTGSGTIITGSGL